MAGMSKDIYGDWRCDDCGSGPMRKIERGIADNIELYVCDNCYNRVIVQND